MNLEVLCLLLAVVGICSCQDDENLCRQMRQLCENRSQTHNVQNPFGAPRVGKAGPRGPPGLPGVADYGVVTAKMDLKIASLKNEMEETVASLQTEIQSQKVDLRNLTENIRIFEAKVSKLEVHFENLRPILISLTGHHQWHQASNGYFYKYFRESLTYDAATKKCLTQNARMIVEGVRNSRLRNRLLHDLGVTNSLWFGATDSQQEGVWIWDDGVPSNGSDIYWQPNEPNNAGTGEDCAIYHTPGVWGALDYPCDRGIHFVCEARY